jgi:hypothetical protein
MQRALVREDFAAAAVLAERALVLVPAGGVDVELEIDHNDAVAFSGRIDAHAELAQATLDRARAANDRGAEFAIRINMGAWETLASPQGAIPRLEVLLDEAFPVLEEIGDHFQLQLAYFARGWIAGWRGDVAGQIAGYERSLEHARHRPDRYDIDAKVGFLTEARYLSPMPADELLAWLEEFGADHRTVSAWFAARPWLCSGVLKKRSTS